MAHMPDKPACHCGAPSTVVLNGLPVCLQCWRDGQEVLGSITPAPPKGEAVLVRVGRRFWRHRWWKLRGPPG